MLKRLTSAVSATAPVAVLLVACGSGEPDVGENPGPAGKADTLTKSVSPQGEPSSVSTGSGDARVAHTVIRFTSDRTSVDVVVGENSPAVRDFLSMLPVLLTVEEFNDTEKIAYLPRKLAVDGSPGSDPEDGDFIYYSPWGSLGFYYDASGVGYSDATVHIGTYRADREQLELLEGDVAVAVVE